MADASVVNVKKLKVADLKKELGLRGLKVTGNKGELQQRLEEYFKLQGLIVEGDNADEVDEDDEEEDSSLEEEDPSSNDNQEEEEEEEEESPEEQQEPTPEPETVTDKPEAVQPQVQETESKPAEEEKDVPEAPKMTSPLNRKIKIAAAPKLVSDVDKKLQRMKRFGGATTEKGIGGDTTGKDKLSERAKRFGTSPVISSDNIKAKSGSEVEKLKQRAERFGAVSPAVIKMEDSEKLKKRKERFGMVSTDMDTRKKMRAERFNL